MDATPTKRMSDRSTKCKTSFKEEEESEEDTNPTSSTTTSQNAISSIIPGAAPKSIVESLRSVRIKRPRKRDESYVYSDDHTDGNEDLHVTKNKNIAATPSSSVPAGSKRKATTATADSEDEPLVQRTSSQNGSSKKNG